MIGIYKLTSPLGKVYIGQSKNIKQRLNNYKKLRCKKQPAIYNALIKYGSESFKFEIIEECEKEFLNELEQFYIKKFNSLSPNGYNLTTGGDCYELSKESKLNCKRAYVREYYSLVEIYDIQY